MAGARLDSRSFAELTGTLICTGSSRSVTTSFCPSWYKEKETVPPACDALAAPPPPPSWSRRPAASSPARRIGKSCAAEVTVTAPTGVFGSAPGSGIAVTTTVIGVPSGAVLSKGSWLGLGLAGQGWG